MPACATSLHTTRDLGRNPRPERPTRRRASRGRPVRTADLALTLVLVSLTSQRAAAQDLDHLELRWWHPVVAAAGIGTLLALDEPVQAFVQNHRSERLDGVAGFATHFHAPTVFAVGSVGAMSLGLLADEPRLAETGLQILGAYGLSSAMMIATKWAAGRGRPSTGPDDHLAMRWFGGGGDSSFPSGAATVVFSLATTLSDAVDHPAVTTLLYAGATLNAWARVNDDRHWLSDVALGALYGVTAAKLVNGRWRILGFRPPTVGVGWDGSLEVGYSVRP